jgi:hypothetical protein
MTEFFIASVSCDPGGQRYHFNVCSNNFPAAVKSAQNLNPYDVFFYGFDMFVWYYKHDGTEFKLMKEIDMNKHIKGAIDLKDNFIPYDKLEKTKRKWFEEDKINHELYKTVIYSDIEEIKLTNPLSDKTRVYIKLPKEKREYLFMLDWGYMWEDSTDIIYYPAMATSISQEEREKYQEIYQNTLIEIKEEKRAKDIARKKELLNKKDTTEEERDELYDLIRELRIK